MHLLLAQQGSVTDTDEAVDLGQSPADLIFLSAADTELSSMASAREMFENAVLSVRVANIMQLSHPMSMDVYAEQTVAKSKLLIARVLGGESYFQYGLEKLLETAQRFGTDLVVLPGDDKPDPGLERYCTLPPETVGKIWEYLKQGGPQNSINLLKYASHLLGQSDEPAGPVPLMKAGIWSPETGITDLKGIQAFWQEGASLSVICFYRALVQSGGLQPIAAMVDTLRDQDINALPVFISSLKDPVSVEILRSIFAEVRPGMVLNTTGFAVSSPTGEYQPTVLDETGNPVIQIVLSSGTRESWLSSSQGLSARDLAMNVALHKSGRKRTS